MGGILDSFFDLFRVQYALSCATSRDFVGHLHQLFTQVTKAGLVNLPQVMRYRGVKYAKTNIKVD
jgi:hypothetical protein